MAAYEPAVLADVQERLIALLNANPGVWAATVSGDVGAFPDDDELLAAIFEADSIVCVDGYFQSVNDSLANQFAVTSAPLSSTSSVPFHKGTLNKVETSISAQAFTRTSGNILTATAHGLTTGQLVSLINVGGALPAGLALLTNYWVIWLSANTFSLAASLANALTASPVTLSGDGTGTHTVIAWQVGVEAKNIDDVTNMIAVGETYINTTGAMDFLYKDDSGVIYTPATYARVTYPEYIKDPGLATLQANETETTLLIMTAAAILAKNASPAIFDYYQGLSQAGIQALVTDSAYTAQHTEESNP